MDFGELNDSQLFDYMNSESGRKKGEALIELGFRALSKLEPNQAISFAEVASLIFREIDSREEEATSLYILGAALLLRGDDEEALAKLNEASNGYREVGEDNLLGLTLFEIAKANESLSRVEKAEDSYISALNILTSANETSSVVQVAVEYGEFLGKLGRQGKALTIFRRAKEYAVNLGQPLQVAHIDDRIAACLIELAEGIEALDHLKSALDVITYAGAESDIAWAMYRYGWTLQTFGFHHQSLNILNEAKQKFQNLSDIRHIALCDFQLAHAYSALGEYQAADELYVKLREVFKSLGMEENALLCEVNRGVNFSQSGRQENARDVYEMILSKKSAEQYCYILRGVVWRLADTFNSMEYYQDALDLLDEINESDFGDDKLARLEFINTRGMALVGCNRVVEAEQQLQEVLISELSQGLEAVYAKALETLSIIAGLKGDDLDALDLRGKAISYYLAGKKVSEATRLAKAFAFAPSETLSRAGQPNRESEQFRFGFGPS